MAVYLLQVMSLGLAGSLLGVAIAQGAVSAIPLALGSSIDVAAGGRALHGDLGRGAAGRDDRRPRVAAVRHRAAAGGAARAGRRCSCATKRGRRGATDCGWPPSCSCRRRSSRSPPGRLRRFAWGSSCVSGSPCWPSSSCWPAAAGDAARAAGERAVVPAAARRAAPVAARQPDARHPAGGRPRRVLHRRRAIAAGEPAGGVLDPGQRRSRPTCSCSTCSAARPTACARS